MIDRVREDSLIEVVEALLLRCTEDLAGLLPDDQPETFTTDDLAES